MSGPSTVELISKLRALNVVLSAHEDRLRINAPAGVITAELRSELTAHKAELLKHLRESAITLPQFPGRDKLPLSFAQQRLWFLGQIEGASDAYHIPLCLRLKGPLDRSALRRALDRIVARHEALRTTFVVHDGEPVQRIAAAEDTPLLLIEHDLRFHPDAEQELDRLVDLEISAPFNFETGPVIRGRLIQLAENEHALLVTTHHIASDGHSIGLLANELKELYAAFVSGQDDPLPKLPLQYADYSVWQRKQVDGDLLKDQASYWKTALAGVPALMDVPADRPRPAVQDYSGAFESLTLDEELTAALKEFSRRHRVTIFMTLMAAWAALLSRLSGQEDILIGTPVANRGQQEIQKLIGFFVNTLMIRMNLSGSSTVKELIEQTKTQAMAALQNQDLPFDKVVELVQPPRSSSYTPLIQVMFAWQNNAREKLKLPELEVEFISIEPKKAKFDLLLDLGESDNVISGGIEYATSLFKRDTIKRYAGYFKNLLRAMVKDDCQRIDQLPLLQKTERDFLIHGLNRTDADFPREKCIHELFEEQVKRTPDATAVVFEDKEISYAELNRRANQLAHHLRAIGVGPDARVAVCVERSFEMVTALMAIVKAGGAYVPLDPSYPAERLRFMLDDAQPVALLIQQHLAHLFAGLGKELPVLDLTTGASAWQDRPEINPDREEVGLHPLHLAYVIYTSGSTGNPKGVLVHHRGVVNRMAWMQDAYGLRVGEPVLQKTPFGFDVSVWEFFWTLQTGARLVMARPEGHKDPGYLVDMIRRHQITTMHFVPSMLQVFLEHDDLSNIQSLVRVVCSGEALSAALLKRFQERIPHAALHNLYGPTEAAVDVTAWTAPAHFCDAMVPIGKPIWNTQMYILDSYREPVPKGVTGELYIGGVQVARGYLNRAKLTEERFVADPFSDKTGARLYRTGDLARWLADGNIEYLGRNDFQVKIRGFRIELGEIETRLAEYPGVGEAAVIAREDTPGDKRLIAYYTTPSVEGGDRSFFGAEQFRAHLLKTLPEYMVPAAYVHMLALPLTNNGKLDRKALPAPETGSYSTRSYEPPVGETETRLAEIWAKLLKLDRVGRHDNFFDLGGHSLLAVQLMLRLQQFIPGGSMSLNALLEAPTVQRFAAWLQERESKEQKVLVQLREGNHAQPPFFCVHASDGVAMGMRPLAMAMESDVTFYCLQAKGLDGSEPFGAVEEYAQFYLDEIRKVQPHGPYHLGGYCFGGIVAFEMAHMLIEAGETVSTLTLIDSYNPSYLRFKPTGEMLTRLLRFYARRVRLHVSALRSLRPGAWFGYSTGRARAMGVHFKRFLKKNRKDTAIFASEMQMGEIGDQSELGTRFGEMMWRLRNAGPEAANKFSPRPYGGGALIIRVSERNNDPWEDYYLGWKEYIHGPMESFEIESDHESILREPAVRMAARLIDSKLQSSMVESHEESEKYASVH